MAKKQLRISFLGILQKWEYNFGYTEWCLFNIPIIKEWSFDMTYPQDRKFGK